MKTLTSKTDLRNILKNLKQQGQSIGFVPTMGALHDGHMSLLEKCRSENDISVLSIFVNPTQFGPNEDFSAYPRTLERDLHLAEKFHVDYVFTPTASDMYADNPTVYVDEDSLSKVLCGVFRPGHFRGVCTVVLKLLNIVSPHRLYLGQKDAQQLRILEKMVEDLDLDTEVIGCPTLREKDGLAMSSRNAYLDAHHRAIAPQLFTALTKGQELFFQGEKNAHVITEHVRTLLKNVPEFKLQYLELRDWQNLELVERIQEHSILACALYLDKTRLIDNVILKPSLT